MDKRLARVIFRRETLCSCLAFGLLIAFANGNLAQENGLLAHDINGFSLDMTVQQVATVAQRPLSSLGGGQYQVKVDGVDYDLGFSVLGHLFRIDSKQELGDFLAIPKFGYDERLKEILAKHPDLEKYLRDTNANAIKHAIRGEINPDDPEDRLANVTLPGCLR